MAGLLQDAEQENAAGTNALAGISAEETRRGLQNYNINAQHETAGVSLVGEGIGAAIGSIWGQSQEGAQIGKQQGARLGGIFSGTGSGDSGGSPAGPFGSSGQTSGAASGSPPGMNDQEMDPEDAVAEPAVLYPQQTFCDNGSPEMTKLLLRYSGNGPVLGSLMKSLGAGMYQDVGDFDADQNSQGAQT